MASERSVDDERMTSLIRNCVREELSIQRSSGNGNLLMRTRDLIANSARSASREMGSLSVINSTPGTSASSSCGTGNREFIPALETEKPSSAKVNIGLKRISTHQHPWRFKRGKQKMEKQEFNPKAVHLLDIPDADLDDEPGGYIPDYNLKDEMVLLKGYFELGTQQEESEIRESITEVLKQRFPFVRSTHFDFVKRERNKISTPIVKESFKWDYKHIKQLCGQGKLYIRLNIPKECIEAIAAENGSDYGEGQTESDVEVEKPSGITGLVNKHKVVSVITTTSVNSATSVSVTASHSQNKPVEVFSATSQLSLPCSSRVNAFEGDKEKLRELLPSASDEELENAMLEFGDLDSAANALIRDSNTAAAEEKSIVAEDLSLEQILQKIGKKLTNRRKKLEVDQDDLVNDAISYYKSLQFDPCCPIRISFLGQPAVDSGGVLRQFYSDLFEKLVEGDLIELFEGDAARKVPSYRPQAIMSGMLELTGKIIAHSLAQGGPGFPFLALPCYYYLVTGDVMCAMAYCNCLDIPDLRARNIVLQIMNAESEEEMTDLCKDDEILNLLSQCGETSVLSVSNKAKVIQGVAMYEVLSKRKVALDQFRKGLMTLGLLSEIQNHPEIFESVFTFKSVELTAAAVKECFSYPADLNEQEEVIKAMVTRFICQSEPERLRQLMQYCTGGKNIPSVPSFKVKVNFHSDTYIYSSTCTFSLQIPNCFKSYGLFEAAMSSAISSSGRSFTTV